jgi:hypothetical protein
VGWINLASSRFATESHAMQLIDDWEAHPDLRLIGFAPALSAATAGRLDLLDRAVPLSLQLLHRLCGNSDDRLATPPLLSDVLNLACVVHLAGHDQHEVFERVAALEGVRHASGLALQQTAARLLFSETDSHPREPLDVIDLRTSRSWFRCLETLPTAQLLSAALCPDHPLWLRVLRHFAMPLAIAMSKERPDVSALDLVSVGPNAQRHQNVLYERRSPRPEWGTRPDPTKPRTWPGFDAIELSDGELLVYHYLGFSWQAPLVFAGDQLNAFAFLEHVDLGWQLVQDQLPAQTREGARTDSRNFSLRSCRSSQSCAIAVPADSRPTRRRPLRARTSCR